MTEDKGTVRGKSARKTATGRSIKQKEIKQVLQDRDLWRDLNGTSSTFQSEIELYQEPRIKEKITF